MTQVIDFIGGEYRNRTGVHGFAIHVTSLKTNGICVNVPHLFASKNQLLMKRV